MKRPWQFWIWYVCGVVIVVATLAWLTRAALELDRSEAVSRRQAELEENVGRALWRMDVRLMPLIAKEAARPYFVYQPFYMQPQSTNPPSPPTVCASPLLTDRPEFIVLNFQVDSANRWTSAQVPPPEQQQRALASGAQPALMFQCETNMTALQRDVAYKSLLGLLPVESVADNWSESSRSPTPADNGQQKVVLGNSFLEENRRQQPVPQTAAPQYEGESVRLQRQQSLNTADLANRDARFQAIAQQEFENQRANYKAPPSTATREGICRPVWVGDRLLLARRVEMNGNVVIQGCWLDWPRIKQVLVSEASELLPDIELVPVSDPSDVRVNRMLATLPVQLIVPLPVAANAWTPIRTALATAWLCVALIAVAGGILLHGVLSLSERRATFVSAVTHELRTPLTTFRLYSEMLAQGMLPDPQQRQKYLETLRVEADRLARLVDNVLCFAKLERGRAGSQRVPLTLQALLDRCQDRLAERASQANLVLHVESASNLTEVSLVTDPSAIEQILFNLVDNAAKYAGRSEDRRLHLRIGSNDNQVSIRLTDHGPGVSLSARRRLFQPFSKSAEDAAHTAPGVGLGLALCYRLAREIGGRLSLDENSRSGASFLLVLPRAKLQLAKSDG